ncbi:MAG: hypothetical protein ACW97O_13670 [Candidatus Thorarchaeota archaeon]|jgi:hypothetical protein
MDDYSLPSLTESKNEWCARLVGVVTPAVIEGMKSIFREAWELCLENDETDKYLLTFQTFLGRIPKWNPAIIEQESKRIVETSNCGYLEDLISCVHVIHLKALTCVRVCSKQKKIDLDIPSVDKFVHNVYINVARKVYTNVYLFEKGVPPLQAQKHARELELIVKECVLTTIRDSIPVERVLRAYMEEGVEEEVDVKEEVIETPAPEPEPEPEEESVVEEAKKESDKASSGGSDDGNEIEPTISIETDVLGEESKPGNVAFSDMSEIRTSSGVQPVPTHTEDGDGKYGADDDDDEDDGPLKIGESIKLEIADVNDLRPAPKINDPVLAEVEVL